MLALFGYDATGDHHRITREQGTRRINLAIPEESMLVERPSQLFPTQAVNYLKKTVTIGTPWLIG